MSLLIFIYRMAGNIGDELILANWRSATKSAKKILPILINTAIGCDIHNYCAFMFVGVTLLNYVNYFVYFMRGSICHSPCAPQCALSFICFCKGGT